MREIKFRGMKENSEWIYGGYVLLGNGAHCILSGEVIHQEEMNILKFHAVKYKTVGQYTGLKDKNGKEIYEGDIVYWKPAEWVTNPKAITGEVFWDNSSLALHVLFSDNNYSCKRWEFLGNRFEIIGNIYENPGLVKIEA